MKKINLTIEIPQGPFEKKEKENSPLMESEAVASSDEIYRQYCLETWILPELTDMLNKNDYRHRVQVKLERTVLSHKKREERLLNQLISQGILPSMSLIMMVDRSNFYHQRYKLNHNHHDHADTKGSQAKKADRKITFAEELNVYHESS